MCFFQAEVSPAAGVEECLCPRNYYGLSCEKCSPGFTRSLADGASCVPCSPSCGQAGRVTEQPFTTFCSNIQETAALAKPDLIFAGCHPESGECLSCAQPGAAGPDCLVCREGYFKDRDTGLCTFDAQECVCHPDGTLNPDGKGRSCFPHLILP